MLIELRVSAFKRSQLYPFVKLRPVLLQVGALQEVKPVEEQMQSVCGSTVGVSRW